MTTLSNPPPLVRELDAEFKRLTAAGYSKFDGFSFGNDDDGFPVDILTLTPTQIACVFRYGRRMFNDSWNSSQEKKDNKSQEDFFKSWISALGVTLGLKDGRGGRGGALSLEQTIEQEILLAELIETGYKKSEAVKFVTAKCIKAGTAWHELTRRLVVRMLGQNGESPADTSAKLKSGIVNDYLEDVKAQVKPKIDAAIAARSGKITLSIEK